MKYTIYTDGASFNNPGPSGAGIAIYKDGALYKEYTLPLGVMTNNQAEYSALLLALKKMKLLLGAKHLKSAEIEVRSDSQLLVNQLNHKYKVLDEKVQKLFFEVWNLLIDFGNVTFVAIPREQNTVADKLSKKAAAEN